MRDGLYPMSHSWQGRQLGSEPQRREQNVAQTCQGRQFSKGMPERRIRVRFWKPKGQNKDRALYSVGGGKSLTIFRERSKGSGGVVSSKLGCAGDWGGRMSGWEVTMAE